MRWMTWRARFAWPYAEAAIAALAADGGGSSGDGADGAAGGGWLAQLTKAHYRQGVALSSLGRAQEVKPGRYWGPGRFCSPCHIGCI
jgi:hypothetical protein